MNTADRSDAALARAALRYLADRQLSPTPANYHRAWLACGGEAPPQDADARRRLERSEQLLVEMRRLLAALCDGLSTLAESESGMNRRVDMLREMLEEGGRDRHALASVRRMMEQSSETQRRIAARRRDAAAGLRRALDGVTRQAERFGESAEAVSREVAGWGDRIDTVESVDALDRTIRALAEDAREMQSRVQREREEFERSRQRMQELEDEVKRLGRELAEADRRSVTDHLTQALNREGLRKAWLAAQERARRLREPLSLALLDVDDFKRLNDALGHSAGDGALQHLSKLMQSKLRPGDHVARWGGEEFVVLLPRADAETARQVMQRLQRELTREVFLHESRQIFLTFSAGLTTVLDDEPLDAAVARADEAMYEAKRAGKNCVMVR